MKCEYQIRFPPPILNWLSISASYFSTIISYFELHEMITNLLGTTTTSRAFFEILLILLGVPTMSRILTGDSQKLSFSTLTKVRFVIF